VNADFVIRPLGGRGPVERRDLADIIQAKIDYTGRKRRLE
jgi:hypothetical protein